jgi:quinol monooxygenase YgiN
LKSKLKIPNSESKIPTNSLDFEFRVLDLEDLMIIASVKIIPLPGKRVEVLEVLRHVQCLMRASAGLISCTIYEECADEPTILYLEHWRSQIDLYRHIQSRLYLQVLTAMDFAREPPEICFHEVANSHGMELIERLRARE